MGKEVSLVTAVLLFDTGIGSHQFVAKYLQSVLHKPTENQQSSMSPKSSPDCALKDIFSNQRATREQPEDIDHLQLQMPAISSTPGQSKAIYLSVTYSMVVMYHFHTQNL